MKNKTDVFERWDEKLNAEFSGEILVWFMQRFRAGNNLQRLILTFFAILSGLASYQWSLAVFCVAMYMLDTDSQSSWSSGVLLYGGQACLASAVAFALFLSYSVIGSFKHK